MTIELHYFSPTGKLEGCVEGMTHADLGVDAESASSPTIIVEAIRNHMKAETLTDYARGWDCLVILGGYGVLMEKDDMNREQGHLLRSERLITWSQVLNG
jgi:hypothetical protein